MSIFWIYNVPVCLLWKNFYLKFVLSYINKASFVLFWLHFAWNIPFHHFTFNLLVALGVKWVSYREHTCILCFWNPFSQSLPLFGEFNPCLFKVIADMKKLNLAICVFYILYLFCSSVPPLLPSFVFDFFFFCRKTFWFPSHFLFSIFYLFSWWLSWYNGLNSVCQKFMFTWNLRMWSYLEIGYLPM